MILYYGFSLHTIIIIVPCPQNIDLSHTKPVWIKKLQDALFVSKILDKVSLDSHLI